MLSPPRFPPRFLAIDPGLDAMGCAVYEPGARPPHEALQWVATVRTAADTPLGDRLYRLAKEAIRLCEEHECGEAVIELPKFTGTYNRNRNAVGRDGMAAGMAKLNLAIGYVAGALRASGVVVRFVAPGGGRKAQKLLVAKGIVTAAERSGRKVTSSGRVPSADALDAVMLGAAHLSDYSLVSRLTRELTGTL